MLLVTLSTPPKKRHPARRDINRTDWKQRYDYKE
jgi:hypothetical protein